MNPSDLCATSRVENNGYIYVRVDNHPSATSTGYVYEHRFVMEQHLGRFLREGEVVHHRNHDRHDNRLENLELTTHSEHARHHGREASEAALVDLVCPHCKSEFRRRAGQVGAGKLTFCTRSCNMSFYKANGTISTLRAGHGSASMYSYHKCRCDDCKAGHRERARAYRLKRKSKTVDS